MNNNTKRTVLIGASVIAIIGITGFFVIPYLRYKLAVKYLAKRTGEEESHFLPYENKAKRKSVMNRANAFRKGEATYLASNGLRYYTVNNVGAK